MPKVRIFLVAWVCVSLITVSASAFKLPSAKDLTQSTNKKETQKTKIDSDQTVIQKSARVGKNVINFAVAGALTGAAVGAATSDEKNMGQNIMRGGIAGAAAGSTVGYIYGTIEAKKMQSRDQAVAKYKYTKDKGTFVKIEKVAAAPDMVSKGKGAAFETIYTVLTPNEKDTVNVYMGFGVVLAALDEGNDRYTPGQLQEFQIKNGGGTFKINVPLKDTKQYEPQSYKFIVGIEAAGKDKKVYQTSSAKFNIMPASAGIRNADFFTASAATGNTDKIQ